MTCARCSATSPCSDLQATALGGDVAATAGARVFGVDALGTCQRFTVSTACAQLSAAAAAGTSAPVGSFLFGVGADGVCRRYNPPTGVVGINPVDTGSIDHTLTGTTLTSTVIVGAPGFGYQPTVGYNGAGNVTGGITVQDEFGLVPPGYSVVAGPSSGLAIIRVPRPYSVQSTVASGTASLNTGSTANAAVSNFSAVYTMKVFQDVNAQTIVTQAANVFSPLDLSVLFNGGALATNTHGTDQSSVTMTTRPILSQPYSYNVAPNTAFTHGVSFGASIPAGATWIGSSARSTMIGVAAA